MGKPLKNLEPRHMAAVRLRLEGKKNDEIARALGMQKRTLEVWFSDPLIKAEVDRQAARIEDVFVEKLAGAGMQALEVMLEVAQMPTADPTTTEHVKIEAAREIMDRTPALARIADRAQAAAAANQGGGTGDAQLVQIFANMPDQQLAEFIQKWQVSDGPGSPAGQPALEG